MKTNEEFLQLAVDLARRNVAEGGGRPFGAVLVKDGEVIATGVNEILSTNDPSTHAEMQAIRAATTARKNPRLDGFTMFAKGQPCPMCLAAIHMTGVTAAYFAYSNEDADPFQMSTARIYAEMAKPMAQQAIFVEYLPVRDCGERPFKAWQRAQNA